MSRRRRANYGTLCVGWLDLLTVLFSIPSVDGRTAFLALVAGSADGLDRVNRYEWKCDQPPCIMLYTAGSSIISSCALRV
jgi:hypothetical protein